MERPTELLRAISNACGPDLIHKRFRDIRPADAHRTWGCCYVATEALYHLWGKKNGFTPRFLRFAFDDNHEDFGHFYLMNKEGVVLDPTRRQFYGSGYRLDYKNGRACGFMTKQPSKRCKVLLSRIRMARTAHA